MNFFKAKYFCFVFCAISAYVSSEEAVCMAGSCFEKEDQLKFSRDRATVIMIGKFNLKNNYGDYIGKNEKISFFELIFSPDEVVKGDVDRKPVMLDLPLMRPHFVFQEAGFGIDDLFYLWKRSVSLLDLNQSRLKYEEIENNIYYEKFINFNSSRDCALVYVSIGSLDDKVRNAVVPVFEGEKYVLMLFRKFSPEDRVFFQSDFNIYPYDIYRRIFSVSKK